MLSHSGVRPFGISLLAAGYDHNGPQLFQIDPSGSYFPWKASAIGKDMNNAKTFLEKRCVGSRTAQHCAHDLYIDTPCFSDARYRDDMLIEDAIHTAILTLKEGFEGEMTEHNVQVSICWHHLCLAC